MPKIDVYNIEGKKVSDIELNENVFGIKPNEKIVHIALVNYMANQRQGTANTKTRAEVAGGEESHGDKKELVMLVKDLPEHHIG